MESPPYEAVIVCKPVALGVYVTEQPPPLSKQSPALKLPDAPSLLQVMVPVGVLDVPGLVSVTVAVQVVEAPKLTELGVQETIVVVLRLLIVSTCVPLVRTVEETVIVRVPAAMFL